jgi:hypothetical protein
VWERVKQNGFNVYGILGIVITENEFINQLSCVYRMIPAIIKDVEWVERITGRHMEESNFQSKRQMMRKVYQKYLLKKEMK